MRKKIIGILICTLVISVFCVPIAGSTNISYKQDSSNPGILNTEDKSAYSKRGNNLDNWGITDSIDLTGYKAAMLRFVQTYTIVPIDGPDIGYVKITDNGGSSWTTLKEIQGQTLEWQDVLIDIGQWAGKTVKIGFEFKTEDSSDSFGWYVDKILIDAEGEFVYLEDFEEYEVGDDWGDWVVTTKSSLNSPPTIPEISGPNNANINTPYQYSFHSFDPELDDISYYIIWGDGNITDWTEPQSSGSSSYTEKHEWAEEGTFKITAQAKDTHNAKSGWSDEFEVKVKKGRSRPSTNQLFLQILEKLLEQLQSSFPIVNKIIESIVNF